MKFIPPSDMAARLCIAPRTLRDRAAVDKLKPEGQREFIRDRRGFYGVDDVREQPAKAPDPVTFAEPIRSQPGNTPPSPGQESRNASVTGDVEKWILIPDVHVPYHDKRAFGLMCRAAKAIGATRCVQMGDLADCYSVSKYPKDPKRRSSAEWELAEVNKALDVLDRVFPDERWITLGNHDVRMVKYLATNAPAVAGMFSLDEMLRFRERGWRVTQYLDSAELGDLEVTHEQGWSGKTAAANAVASSFESQANAHTHFLTFHAVGGGDVRTRVGAQFGWLGSYEFIDYAHRKKIMRSHAHGFGIAYVVPGGRTHVVPVVIMDGCVVVEGKVVR